MDMNTLVKNVKQWGKEKGITKANPRDQYLKVVEETGELGGSLARNDIEGAKDDLGDIMITVILEAETLGLDIEDCLAHAYNEVSGRTGKMVDGIFIKSDDLEKIKEKGGQ